MTIASDYEVKEPSRKEIDELQGAALLEFGSSWCGFCLRAEPLVREELAGHPNVRHIKIADGRGQLLGRSFRVKLWPTLVFLKDGREVSRLVRPADRADIGRAMASIEINPSGPGQSLKTTGGSCRLSTANEKMSGLE